MIPSFRDTSIRVERSFAYNIVRILRTKDGNLMDLHRLQLLRELKRHGTLASVAQSMSYSKSTISAQLSQLEKETGVQLLEPSGRRVSLTVQAEILLAHAEVIFEQVEMAKGEIAASLEEIAGTLRIASFQTAALGLLPAVLERMEREHPRLRMEVTELEPERSLPALLAQEFDLVLAEEFPEHPQVRPAGLDREDLLLDRMHLATPRAWGCQTIEDLALRPWVMEPEGTAQRAWAVAVCRSAGFEPDVRFTATDVLLHARLVETELAAALLPDLLWYEGRAKVVLCPLPGDPARRIYTAARRGATGQPAVRAFRKGLKEELLFDKSSEL
ncbi:LysR family transcriptional regulator [Glutamicibacter sp. NPDC090743]|uniref:LysR family transcriptional regulator n=1 Tax=Glutamicibacter sp. NPDC090743 TaxID=3364001 RepID=UPI00381BDA63